VAGGRNRKEFSETLDQAHDDCLNGENDIHGVFVLWK
jgi:hypothetical protein